MSFLQRGRAYKDRFIVALRRGRAVQDELFRRYIDGNRDHPAPASRSRGLGGRSGE